MGIAPPLGVRVHDGGCTVSVMVSDTVTSAWLCHFGADAGEHRTPLTHRNGNIFWEFIPGLAAGTRYGFRVEGTGHNIEKLLVDTYARSIDGNVDWVGAKGAMAIDDPRDSAPFVPRSVVVDNAFDWSGDAPPLTPWTESVIYEVHVKNATQLHPDVPEALRGTYAGLAHPSFISHLVNLGVTAVELLPVHQHTDEARLNTLGLINHWGYNTLGFFAPDHRYSASGAGGEQVSEFKGMVKLLHEAGLEVLLDVVYNHTAEAGPTGPALSMRGFDSTRWYREEDVTGCGNTMDLQFPPALRLTLDSLRYWVQEMHVDGFRFDLAPALCRDQDGYNQRSAFLMAVSQDPVLSQVKLIAEPWDVGPGGYQLGAFPAPWAEWNDRFRDTVRDHWRNATRSLGEVAERIAGSRDVFGGSHRQPWASVNFVSAHDGMTINDLVTYNDKHNEANGEENRDGTGDNRSWNCGVEGPTDDPDINALRNRQRRNLLATLLLAQGTPMLLAGDEVAHSQQGNNNAYCQDDEISWINWAEADTELLDFTRRLIALRRTHSGLRRSTWLAEETDAAWFSPSGTPMTIEEWNNPHGSGLQLLLTGDRPLLICMNDDIEALNFVLPEGEWFLELSTDPLLTAVPPTGPLTLVSRSIAVLGGPDGGAVHAL